MRQDPPLWPMIRSFAITIGLVFLFTSLCLGTIGTPEEMPVVIFLLICGVICGAVGYIR